MTNDTIIAPATAPGRSAVALLRLSGPRSKELLQKIFKPNRNVAKWTPWTLRTGVLIDPSQQAEIDRGMAVWMAAPNSYTGEQSAEISCHGSSLIVERLLKVFIKNGARLAEPGEFSRRAFLNGKMDLVQAEAVCDLVSAETAASADVALRQLSGGLSGPLAAVREDLLNVAAEIEAHIDFPDEDVPPADQQRLMDAIKGCHAQVEEMLSRSQRGRRLREGTRIAIVGRTNVGKSSLFNAIVGSERAIATPHPGTTRDTIEARIEIGGLAVNLIDTAGIRQSDNEIEQAGIERSCQEIERSDLIFFVVDGSAPLSDEDVAVGRSLAGRPVVLVRNKSDLPQAWAEDAVAGLMSDGPLAIIKASAKRAQGILDLENAIKEILIGGGTDSTLAALSNVRHILALEGCGRSLQSAIHLLQTGESLEFVATDLTVAVGQINQILGLSADEDLLDRVFQKFCIGK